MHKLAPFYFIFCNDYSVLPVTPLQQLLRFFFYTNYRPIPSYTLHSTYFIRFPRLVTNLCYISLLLITLLALLLFEYLLLDLVLLRYFMSAYCSFLFCLLTKIHVLHLNVCTSLNTDVYTFRFVFLRGRYLALFLFSYLSHLLIRHCSRTFWFSKYIFIS